MKFNTHSLLSAVLLFFASNLVGQDLDQLISIGIPNNLQLRALEMDFQAAMQRAEQVDVLPNPEIGIGAFPLPVETRLGPQLARVGVSQAFPWLGTLRAKRRLQEDAAKPILKNMDAEVIALTYKIKIDYFNIYEVGRKRDILSERLEMIRVLENLALSKVESGKTTIADVLRIQSFKEDVQLRLEILDLEEAQSNIKLNTLLNRNTEERITLDTSLTFRQNLLKKEIFRDSMIAQHPAAQVIELSKDIARNRIDINKFESKPSFAIGADYVFVGNGNNISSNQAGRDILQIKAAVKLPIYRRPYEAKEREEVLRIGALEKRKEGVMDQLGQTINLAYIQHEMAERKYLLAESQIELISTALNVLIDNYSASGEGFEELISTEINLIDLEVKRLEAIVESHLAMASLERFIFQN